MTKLYLHARQHQFKIECKNTTCFGVNTRSSDEAQETCPPNCYVLNENLQYKPNYILIQSCSTDMIKPIKNIEDSAVHNHGNSHNDPGGGDIT